MKTFRSYSLLCVVLMTTILTLGFSSCSKDDNEKNDNTASIVGTWEGMLNGSTVIYVFGADEKGSLTDLNTRISVNFTYSYDTKSRYLTIYVLGNTEVFEIYTLTATTLSGRNVKSNGIMSFTRK